MAPAVSLTEIQFCAMTAPGEIVAPAMELVEINLTFVGKDVKVNMASVFLAIRHCLSRPRLP